MKDINTKPGETLLQQKHRLIKAGIAIPFESITKAIEAVNESRGLIGVREVVIDRLRAKEIEVYRRRDSNELYLSFIDDELARIDREREREREYNSHHYT